MAAGRLFRGVNLYLVLAGLLSGAMLAAPIAYASNFAAGLHATIYGCWVSIEESLGHGVTATHSLRLWQLPMHIVYSALGILAGAGALVLTFVNANGERKQLWLGRMLMLALVHGFVGVVLQFLAIQHVGTSEVEGAIEAGFQREMVLHLFIFYFFWRAWRKQAAEIRA